MAQLKDTVVSGNLRVTDKMMGSGLDLTSSSYGPLSIFRSSSNNAGIKFYNNGSTYLGSLALGTANGRFTRFKTDESTSYTIIDTSLLNVTEATNLGLDGGTNAFGYVSGLTKAAWNFQQTDGTIIRQFYSASWKSEIYMDYRTGQMSTRGKNNGTWQDWRIHLDSGNYTDYTVTKTGGGASGSWGINITGNAATSEKSWVNRTIDAGTYSLPFLSSDDSSASYDLYKNVSLGLHMVNKSGGAEGHITLLLGYPTTTSTYNKAGEICLYSNNGGSHAIITGKTANIVTHTLPTKSGTLFNTGNLGIATTAVVLGNLGFTRSNSGLYYSGNVDVSNLVTKIFAVSIYDFSSVKNISVQIHAHDDTHLWVLVADATQTASTITVNGTLNVRIFGILK